MVIHILDKDVTSSTADSPDRTMRLERIWTALRGVSDPEIPPLSIVDLGIIADVHVSDDAVRIDLTPTFAGCPALDMIREEIRSAVRAIGESDVTVKLVFDPPWTSDRLSDNGRRVLKEIGLAPPGQRCAGSALPDLTKTPCPYCDSMNTELESLFGPTLCRSIHYCHACRQSFEHFKAV